MTKFLIQLAFVMLISLSAFGQTPLAFDLDHAKAYFDEARKISDKDGGKLWGLPLYGPVFFVDGPSHMVIANQQDKQGLLHAKGDFFEGKLEGIDPSDDDIDWAGKHWTMLTWQTIPEDRLLREKLFAHEMFHRLQQDLKLRALDSFSLHLDSKEGRIWLQLEWRALAAALIKRGTSQDQAVKDALTFREHRHQLYPGSDETERLLEMAEGVPEYTGLVVASPDSASAKWFAAARLLDPDLTKTFVRSFAYTSGPAYGLLLDERLPGWRKKLSVQSDLSKLLASTIKGSLGSADARASAYGLAAIRISEEDLSVKTEAIKTRYRNLLVDGPTLTLPRTENIKFTFNPSTLVSLGDKGIVHPTLKVIASWGTMDVTDGAILPKDRSQVTVAAPARTVGPRIEGPGWVLNLSKGWQVVPSAEQGSFLVQKLKSP